MTSHQSVDIAVVGYGHIGPAHAAAVMRAPNARLVAIADPCEEARARARRDHPDVAISAGFEELLRDHAVDAVILCTPPHTHASLALAAFGEGKHVLCEKPLATTLSDADTMIRVAQDSGCRLGTVAQRRFEPALQAAHRAVREGALGALLMVSAYKKWQRSDSYFSWDPWRASASQSGGGAVMSIAIHSLDLLQWFTGPWQTIFAFCDTRTHDIEVEDVAVATVRYQTGAIGVVETSFSTFAPQADRLELHGETGSIIITGSVITTWSLAGDSRTAEDLQRADPFPEPPDSAQLARMPEKGFLARQPRYIECLSSQVQDFAAAVLGGREPAVTGLDGRAALEMVHAIYASARSGRPVHVDDLE